MRKAVLSAIIISILLCAMLWLSAGWTGESQFANFIGRFHPLILHIPIGSLIALLFLESVFFFSPKIEIGKASTLLLKFAAWSSIPTVLAGFLLAANGGYDDTTLNLHRNLGLATAAMSFWLLVLKDRSHLSSGKMKIYRFALVFNVILLSMAGHLGGSLTHGSSYLTEYMPSTLKAVFGVVSTEDKLSAMKARDENSEDAIIYNTSIKPILEQKCISCHGVKKQKGNVRLDVLDWDMVNGSDAEKWHAALDMINSGEMPPPEEEQLSQDEREEIVNWMTESLAEAAKFKKESYAGTMRRLTKKQYTNSLISILNLPVNFGDALPDDGKSEMGFSNNAEVLQTSALHVDYYQKIAREALDKAIVTKERPKTYRYKVTLGEGLGKGSPSSEYGGYQTAAIRSDDIRVDLLDNEGNPIVSGSSEDLAKVEEVKGKIGIGMRGSKSERYKIVKEGLILSSALPAKEVAPKSWQGPSPNMKLLIGDEFPREGNFVMRVEVSRGYPYQTNEDKLISLRERTPNVDRENAIILKATDCKETESMHLEKGRRLVSDNVASESSASFKYEIPQEGYYLVEIVHPYKTDDSNPSYTLSVYANNKKVSDRLYLSDSLSTKESIEHTVTLAYLTEGEKKARIGGKFFVGFEEIRIIPIASNDPLPDLLKQEAIDNFERYDGVNPSIRAFAGSRTDDGMDYRPFDEPVEVTAPFGESQIFDFHGRLENLPVPNDLSLTSGDLSGIFTLGLWNNHIVKNASDVGPTLLIKSIEFEGPYYPNWPPESHTGIFLDSRNKENKDLYTKEILESFLTKAFRRPAEKEELERYYNFWKQTEGEFDNYEEGIKEVLVAILCSPNFLYYYEPELAIVEKTKDDFFIASELSYFLWNTSPDDELKKLAKKGRLVRNLDDQVERMLEDDRAGEMIESFAYDWLRLDRHKGMNTDVSKYEDYTRFVKEDMVNETYHFLKYLLKNNLSIMNMVDSDFAMLNQNLAEFYGIEGVVGNEFRPVDLAKEMNRGGLLSQGAFLNGHSDGVQAHPIKRAVWLKEKILGDSPPPPPPNVPELDPDIPGIEHMTLKDQLFLHRNKPSCMGCHEKIDPYGVVFENYDAVGRYQMVALDKPIDAKAILPDGQEVEGVQGIKEYILNLKQEDFTRSFVEHLYAYALGRDVTYADEDEIEDIVEEVIADDYRFHTVIKEIVKSPSFSGEKENGWFSFLGLIRN